MMISTRGRYALRVLIDLAEHRNGSFIPLKEVAARQEISLKYVEQIMSLMSAHGIVEAAHGKGGGYRISREPSECRVGEILRLTEGTLAPVSCLEENAAPCSRSADCRTLPLWKKLSDAVNTCLDGITLADLTCGDVGNEYVI